MNRTPAQNKLLEQMRTASIEDGELWNICHEVAADEDMPMGNRLESLAKMNEITGESDPCTVAALRAYLKDVEGM